MTIRDEIEARESRERVKIMSKLLELEGEPVPPLDPLTQEQAGAIRLKLLGGKTCADLAVEYGVSYWTVYWVSWRRLQDKALTS